MSYQEQSYGGPANDLPPGWIARWDDERRCYFYINEQTGEETLQKPGFYGRQGPPQQQGYYDAPPQQQQQQSGGGHGLAYGLMGAAAGLVGGALMMDEGQKVGKWPSQHARG